ncbi:hypothetical protein BDP55DRAFT_720971 [Colletotrichum godetiae]|uniref:Uncharacterized protein n=1 Tax=Colletotrichum godetiae TaxID=1209918 RepID=A0AAJ0A7T1_9PEZI|nr:uncharacterized protein BDP55DRAFT_720971 [Colletotrichum godetiae]KAK1658093.1 hypothetical protein BDP55DRAFT_720971 [Colletotrichum godetiae]
MACSPVNQQALVPVCRGTPLSTRSADPFVTSPQPWSSAWQAPSLQDFYGTADRRDSFPCYEAPPNTSAPPGVDRVDSSVFPDLVEPNQYRDGILDPALVEFLQLDVGEQYIIERRLQRQPWKALTAGFQQRFGVSASSKQSALMMRLSRLKKEHPQIRSLFEKASLKGRSRRPKEQGYRRETPSQDRDVAVEETIGVGHGDGSQHRGGGRRGKPPNRPQKSFYKGRGNRITQSEAAAAADMVLIFVSQPEVREWMADAEYKSLVRVRSRLREQADIR